MKIAGADLPHAPPRVRVFMTVLALIAAMLGILQQVMDVASILYGDRPIADRLVQQEDRIVGEGYRRFTQLAPGPPDTTFEKYLLSQNTELVGAIDRLCGSPSNILIVHAPAGYGKTDLVDDLIADRFADRLVIEIEPRDFASELRADLLLNGSPVNSLPALSDDDLGRLLSAAFGGESTATDRATLVVVDGLDELDTASALRLLMAVGERAGPGARREADVVFFTRPELLDVLKKRDNTGRVFGGTIIVGMHPQEFHRDTLHLRVRNFLNFKAAQGVRPPAVPPVTVDGINDEATVLRVTAGVQGLLEEYPPLIETFRLSTLSALVIEHVLDPQASSLGSTPAEMRKCILSRVLSRNEGSHGRPTEQKTDYYLALASIAAVVRPDADGFFDVPLLGHTIGQARSFEFAPYDVLQRSGLISLKPFMGNGRMRFEPIWLQSEIVASVGLTEKGIDPWRVALMIVAAVLLALAAAGFAPRKRPTDPGSEGSDRR